MSVSATEETVVLPGNFVANGRTVPLENGWTWIADAWSIFRRAPGIWIGMVLTLTVIYIVLAVLPVIGAIASFVLGPVFTAGLVVVSRTIDQGGAAQFSQLFAGFKHRFGTLLVVGVIYFVLSVVIIFAAAFATGLSITEMFNATSPEAVLALGLRLILTALIILALMLPLVMAIWFAPPLVAFQKLGPGEALRASFLGCLRNMLPFLLYGVVLLVAAVIASIPFGLGWLILWPVIGASIYTAYRDIYFTG